MKEYEPEEFCAKCLAGYAFDAMNRRGFHEENT